jgi:hypothetical protein
MLKRIVSTSVLVVLVFAVASGANAFTFDKRTYFTFNQPVALPGVTLPAGTYMFRLADPTTGRKVIQVTNETGNASYAILHSMPISRANASADPEIRFIETSSGAPAAVRAWWYGGESIGYQFVYPKDQLEGLTSSRASELPGVAAAEAPAAVAADAGSSLDADRPLEDPVTSPGVVDGPGVPPNAEAEARADASPAQEPPVGAQAQSEAQAPPQAREQPEARAETRDELPRTAGPLPLLLLSGIATAAFGLRMARKS